MKLVLVVVIAVLPALACAERDEIIATVPDGGAGGEGGSGGAPLWAPPVELDATCGSSGDVALADLDGDGVDDLLVAGDCLEVRRGGSTLSAPETPIASFALALAVGRIHTDHPDGGPLDVVTLRAGALESYRGDGLGGFTLSASTPAAGPSHPGDLALAPLYGSGALELVLRNESGLEVWTGDASGHFVGPHPASPPTEAFAVANVDDDDLPDLLHLAASGLVLARNRGDGSFAAPEVAATAVGLRSVRAADLDGDGCLDAAAIDGSLDHAAPVSGRLHWFIGDCAGGFTPHDAPLPLARDIAIGDLDHDDAPDLIAATDEPAVVVYFGRTAFGDHASASLPGRPGRLAVGEIDGDGRPDVVVTLPDAGAVAVLRGL